MKPAGGKPRHFMPREEIMRPGYFKTNETDASAAIIFPATFCKQINAVDLARWLPHFGITERLTYVSPNAKVVPITQNGILN